MNNLQNVSDKVNYFVSINGEDEVSLTDYQTGTIRTPSLR